MDPHRPQGPVRAAALAIGIVRLGAGLALGAAPNRFLHWEAVPAGSAMGLTLRTVGIRDLALGLGTLHAVASSSSASDLDLRRWLGAGLVSDALDVLAGLTSARTTGTRGVVSALVALPMVGLDVWALSSATAARDVGPRDPVAPLDGDRTRR